MGHITLEDAAKLITHLYFGIFIGFSAIAIALLVRLWLVSKKKGWEIKKIIHCMIPVGLLLRAAWFGILLQKYYSDNELLLIAPLNHQTASSIIVGSLPGYWSVSDYLLICLFWVHLSQYSGYSQTSREMKKIRNIYLIINVAIYAIWLALMVLVLSCTCPRSTRAHTAEAIFACILNLIMGLLFSIIGPRMYAKMKVSFSWHASPKLTLLMRRVSLLSFVCCGAFFLRSLVLGLSFFVFTTNESIFVATCVYLLFLESVPEMLILYVMGLRSDNKPAQVIGEHPSERTPMIHPRN